jgi:succinate dehydrogenase/fumarate reductase flavoprotein subunit
MMKSGDIITADVIVVGGAITGMWAAIRAKQLQPESEVLIVDKGKVGKTGCANWGGGITACPYPTDDLDKLVRFYTSPGAGIADPAWAEFSLKEIYEHVREMNSWGIPFERDEKGEMARVPMRVGGTLCAIAKGSSMLKYMRRRAESLGVKFVDKVMVTELMTSADGEVCGAVGFRIGEDEVKPCVFQASAIVLVPGPCSFKTAYIGHRMATGDGIAMAYRQGAELMGMEFAVSHNLGPRDFDISGMLPFVAMGGKFVNGSGEEFMQRYDPILVNKANLSRLIFAIVTEVREGRGPIYFDMTAVAPEELELSRKIMPFTFMALDRMGLNFRRDRIEWIICLSGNRSTGAGLRISRDMSTTIPRLFTGGDTGGKYHYGAGAGTGGLNFAWCAVSGYRAGESVIKVLREGNHVKLSSDAISRALEYQLAPLHNKEGLTPDEIIGAIQDALIPYDVLVLKHASRLNKALQTIAKINRGIGFIRAANSHELMKAHEANNMATVAEMLLRASLLRAESRGLHHREDFPERDDINWKTWLYLKNEQGKMQFWVEGKPDKKRILG